MINWSGKLTLVLTFILLAVSLASRMNCLESSLRTTISPDFCTVLKASAVLWSYLFSTVSICRKISLEIPLTCQENISQFLLRGEAGAGAVNIYLFREILPGQEGGSVVLLQWWRRHAGRRVGWSQGLSGGSVLG